MKRVSVDIGGTFTDCFVAWDGSYVEGKALTTHQNLALGFNEAMSLSLSNSASPDAHRRTLTQLLSVIASTLPNDSTLPSS